MIKAVITAAGKGVRLLPATKELPKEMMPIFSRSSNGERIVVPLLQFIFEQLYYVNIRDFCFVRKQGCEIRQDLGKNHRPSFF